MLRRFGSFQSKQFLTGIIMSIHAKIDRLAFAPLHHTVRKLIEAAESGNVLNVKHLLAHAAFPEGVATASSQALGHIQPLEHPIITADIFWDISSHSNGEVRPHKRTLQRVWQQISKCLNLLLDVGADPDATDEMGVSILNNIISYGELYNVFNRLLQLGANPNTVDRFGGNPLLHAVSIGNKRCTQLLLDYGANPDCGRDSYTVLMSASSCQNLPIVQKLLDAGANINRRDKDGKTALMHALIRQAEFPLSVVDDWIRNNHDKQRHQELSLSVTRLLISFGAEYKIADIHGYAQADYALLAYLNGVEVPDELKPNQVYLQFCRATIVNNAEVMSSISASESLPIQIKTIALHLAAIRGHLHSCEVLLELGADASGVDIFGNYPIATASIGLHLPVVQLLFVHGIAQSELNQALLATCMATTNRNDNLSDDERATFASRRVELARFLLEKGADPNFKDDFNDVPLKQAVLVEEDCKLAALLLEFGADPLELGPKKPKAN